MHKLQITYEQLLETIQEGICVYDADFNINFVNPKVADILGYEVEEIIGRPFIDFFNEEGIKKVEERIKERKSGISETYEEKLKHKDGHEVWVEIKATPIIDDEGNFNGGILGFTDIADRKLAEEEANAFRDFMDSVPGFGFAKDSNLKYVTANRTFCDLLNIPYDEIKGKTDFDIFPPDLANKYITDDKRVLASKQSILSEEETIDANSNKRFVVATRKHPWFDKNGNIVGVYGIGFDITELKRAEDALRESEEKFRYIFDHSPIGIFYANNNGVITDCNEVFVKSMGSTNDALVGLDILSLPDQRIVQSIKGALKGQVTTFEGVYESTTADKTTPIRALYAPIKNSDDSVIGVVAIVEDITERKKIEEEIRALNEELEERVSQRTAQLVAANSELDAFTYSASHDLRGPLNRIGGFSEALLEDYTEHLDQQGKDYLQRIYNSSRHMGELIDDLLKLSRVSQHQISRDTVEVSALVNAYLKELQAMEPDRQVEIVIKPGLVVEADTALMRIALENLLNNAWKFSAGEDLSRIEFGSTVQEGKEVFYIRDNGTGFDMKYADKLFTAFKRLHDTKTYPGTGVGLSIVSRIISRHGGEIWAEGEPGKGACFYFTLS